jgi:hypothetical protein
MALDGFPPGRPAGTAIIRKWKKTNLQSNKTADAS